MKKVYGRMGSRSSKPMAGPGKGQQIQNGGASPSPQPTDDYEDLELRALRRTIKRDPEMFILNNLMMCVQFFGNYEEEIEHVKETLVSSREAELNKHLPPQKHVLLPDVLQEHVAKNVGFTSTRQTFRPTIEPLQPVRIFMVHDNFDITEQHYPAHYSSVNDTVMYSLRLRPTDHQGYVQLQLLDEMPHLKSQLKEDEVDLSSTTREEDEIYSDGDSVYGPRPNASAIMNRPAKSNLPRSVKHGQSRSLPDLHDDEIYGSADRTSPENLYGARSIHNMKFDSDYEHASSTEERRYRNRRVRFRGEFSPADPRRYPGQVSRTKKQQQQQQGNYSRASSTSSGYRSGNYAMDSDSSYNANRNPGLTHSYSSQSDVYGSKSPSKLDPIDDTSIEAAELPRKCFKKVTYTVDGKIYDPREEKKQLLNSKQRRIKQALRRQNYDVTYVSSFVFMKHFVNLFVHRLADSLGFDKEAVEDVKREGCVIYCDKVTGSVRTSRVEQYEIIPAVWLEWPECAQEWLDRPRSTWPDYDDVGKIKDFGCYVVPEGFMPKKGSNTLHDLQWQLTFPAAERYLETCMTQPQVQVYLIALMLHKTFMRPVFDTMFGLTTAHIRNKLFWMIEEHDRPSKWPDTRTGECLLTLLNSLYHCISQNEPTLRDYFVRDRNLFQRVPCEHLLHTQKQLKRIIENPVMYVLHAMENIRHSEKFFPRLDYEHLLNILTVDTLALINPSLATYVSRPVPVSGSEDRPAQEHKFDEKVGFWDNAKTQKPQQKTYGTRPLTNKTLINTRKATDSIIEIPVRCAELVGPRLCILLEFFVQHFIKIAKQCHQYRAYRQKAVYLNQAERLCILLFEFPSFKDDVRSYRDRINILRKRSSNIRFSDDPPETPKRNFEKPIFVESLRNRFVREPKQKGNAESSPEQVERRLKTEDGQGSANGTRQMHTRAVVHQSSRLQDVEAENGHNTRDKQSSLTTNGVESQPSIEVSSKKEQRVVSLIESQDESYLTETTYI